MKRHILLLEDNDAQARSLEKMIKNYSAEIQISHAATLPRARLLLDSGTVFNAFFLDISLASDSINRKGLQLAMDIRSFPQYSQAPILFITAYPEHISPAINELHCFAYLVKPYTEQELHRQLADLFEGSRSTILLKTSEKIYIRIALDSLQYIYSQGRYLNFVTTTACYRSRQYTLKGLTTLLPDDFVRCHKSYIINLAFVENFDFVNHYAHITASNTLIPLSRDFHIPWYSIPNQ